MVVDSLPCMLPLRMDSRWGPRSNRIHRDQPNSTNSSDKSRLTCQFRQSCPLHIHLDPPAACEWHPGGRRLLARRARGVSAEPAGDRTPPPTIRPAAPVTSGCLSPSADPDRLHQSRLSAIRPTKKAGWQRQPARLIVVVTPPVREGHSHRLRTRHIRRCCR
jgi:hypothetical protein